MSAASIFKVQPPTGKPVFITGGKEVFDGYSVHKDVSSLSLSVRVSRLFEFVKKYFQSFFPPAQATDLEKLSALRERQWLLQTAYFGKEQLLILTHRTPKPDDQDLIGGLVPPPSNSLTSDVQAAALPVLTPVPAPKPMSRPNVPSSASSASTAQLPATPSSSQVAPTPFPRAKQRLNFDLPDATPASEHQPSVQKEASSASSASTAQLPASPSAVPVAQTAGSSSTEGLGGPTSVSGKKCAYIASQGRSYYHLTSQKFSHEKHSEAFLAWYQTIDWKEQQVADASTIKPIEIKQISAINGDLADQMYKQIKDIENDPSPNTKSVLIETAEGFAVHFRCVKVEGQINNLELLYVPNPLFEAFQPIATELACSKSKKGDFYDHRSLVFYSTMQQVFNIIKSEIREDKMKEATVYLY